MTRSLDLKDQIKMYTKEEAEEDYINITGRIPEKVETIRESGSNRSYFRIFDSKDSFILCNSDNITENNIFIDLTYYFNAKGVPVPQILKVKKDKKVYLLEDLGRNDLLSFINTGNDFESLKPLLRRTIMSLVKFQTLPYAEWKSIVGFPPFDESLINFDLNYAIQNLISIKCPEYNEEKLWVEFKILKDRLLSLPKEMWGLMYRDFQSRNIMVKNERNPYFIDYQSSRFGPLIYDIASFAWQAKAGFRREEREIIIDMYIEELQKYRLLKGSLFKCQICYWGVFRIIQTLGAYGLRGLKEGKTHFIESIPMALENLSQILEDNNLNNEFPYLYELIQKIRLQFT